MFTKNRKEFRIVSFVKNDKVRKYEEVNKKKRKMWRYKEENM
jgi:hypothetical protein